MIIIFKITEIIMNDKSRHPYYEEDSKDVLYDKYPTIDEDGSDVQGIEHSKINKHDPITRNKKKRETETVYL